MDRSYIDYAWLHGLSERGVFFVTRMKADIQYEVVARRRVPGNGPLRCDEEIAIHSVKYGVELRLRRIVKWDEEKQEELVFLTNHWRFAA